MKNFILLILLFTPGWLCAKQIADTTYSPVILHPAYSPGEGSVVFIDEGHHNFHTKNGRYKPFSNLLERDGYIVREYKGLFNQHELAKGQILVISNALNETTVNDWFLPTPSAFTKTEIEAVKNWVYSGGSLFLIADHMPLAGAAEALAAEFEFEFTNGFVFDTLSSGPAYFNLKDKSLNESIITRGRDATESVEQIATFTGQALKIPNDATPVLIFDEKYLNVLPDTAWVFDDETTRYSVKGWSQGAYKKIGKGRIVVFGEAAMFSAQIVGLEKFKMGMNNKVAPENHQLLLNIIHWLDGMLD
jgi:uncharacterized protein (DUF2249 family)